MKIARERHESARKLQQEQRKQERAKKEQQQQKEARELEEKEIIYFSDKSCSKECCVCLPAFECCAPLKKTKIRFGEKLSTHKFDVTPHFQKKCLITSTE